MLADIDNIALEDARSACSILEGHLPHADFRHEIKLETVLFLYCRDRRTELAKPTSARMLAIGKAITQGKKFAAKLRSIDEFLSAPNISGSRSIDEHVARLEALLKLFEARSESPPRLGLAREALAKGVIDIWRLLPPHAPEPPVDTQTDLAINTNWETVAVITDWKAVAVHLCNEPSVRAVIQALVDADVERFGTAPPGVTPRPVVVETQSPPYLRERWENCRTFLTERINGALPRRLAVKWPPDAGLATSPTDFLKDLRPHWVEPQV